MPPLILGYSVVNCGRWNRLHLQATRRLPSYSWSVPAMIIRMVNGRILEEAILTWFRTRQYLGVFANLRRTTSFAMSDKITGSSHEDVRTFVISRWIFLKMRNVPDKSCIGIRTHFMFNNFFFGNCAILQDRPQVTIWRMRFACWVTKDTRMRFACWVTKDTHTHTQNM